LSDEEKIRYKNAAQSQINMLTNKKIKTVVALSTFAEQVIPQLLEDIKEVRNFKETDDSYYMYQAHDNFGTYESIFLKIKEDLNNPELMAELEQ